MPMQWINVKDKLPKDGQRVIVYKDYGDDSFIATADYNKNGWGGENDNSISEKFLLDLTTANFYLDDAPITYWMPLPKPPEDEQ